jgi:hypothetical protein
MKTLDILFRYLAIRISYVMLTVIILTGAYLYSIPHFSIGSFTLVNEFYHNVNYMPLWLYVVDYFIFLFILSIVIIIGWTVKYSLGKNRNNRSDKQFDKIFLPKLFDYLFQADNLSEKENHEQLKNLKNLLRNDHLRRSLINTLRTIYAQTQGVVNERIKKILDLIDYDYLIKAYLDSPYVKDKMFALKAIAVFRLAGYENKIIKLANNKNFILRSEAIITMMHLRKDNKPLLFIFHEKYDPTLWDFNVIVKTVKELEIRQIDYKELIESENPIIAALGITLAKINDQFVFKALIQRKVDSQNKIVSDDAFLFLIKFAETNDDFKFLMDNYVYANENIQLEIINCLINSEDFGQNIRFLKWIVENRPIRQKVAALYVLLEIDINSLLEYKSSKDESIRKSCLQTLDINL